MLREWLKGSYMRTKSEPGKWWVTVANLSLDWLILSKVEMIQMMISKHCQKCFSLWEQALGYLWSFLMGKSTHLLWSLQRLGHLNSQLTPRTHDRWQQVTILLRRKRPKQIWWSFWRDQPYLTCTHSCLRNGLLKSTQVQKKLSRSSLKRNVGKPKRLLGSRNVSLMLLPTI